MIHGSPGKIRSFARIISDRFEFEGVVKKELNIGSAHVDAQTYLENFASSTDGGTLDLADLTHSHRTLDHLFSTLSPAYSTRIPPIVHHFFPRHLYVA